MDLSGEPFAISSALVIQTSSKSGILGRGINRYVKYIEINREERRNEVDDQMLKVVKINVKTDNETLGIDSSYRYTIDFRASDTLDISADTPYAAL